MHIFCCMHIVIEHCGVCGLTFVDLSLGSASGESEEVFWSSLSVAGCLCNFMANCIVSMQQCLFTWVPPHKSPRAPINMSETSWTLSMKNAELIFRRCRVEEENFQSTVVVHCCVCVERPHEMVLQAQFGSCLQPSVYKSTAKPQLATCHELCNENAFKMDDFLLFLLQPINAF